MPTDWYKDDILERAREDMNKNGTASHDRP